MKIKLKNAWYVNETLYGIGEHEVPNEWYDILPSSAEVSKGSMTEVAKEPEFVPAASLKDLDVARSQGDRELAFVKGNK